MKVAVLAQAGMGCRVASRARSEGNEVLAKAWRQTYTESLMGMVDQQ